MRNIRLYFLYISAVLKSTMEYKLSFVLVVIGRFIVDFNGFLGIYFIFTKFSQIKGYSYGEVMLCFSIMQMSFSIAECIGSGIMTLSGIIRRGEFDRILLRPCSPILQVLGTKFEISRIGPMGTAVIMLIVGIRNSSVTFQVSTIATLVLMIVGGIILFLGIFLLGSSICFFLIDDPTITHILTYGGKEHGKYPFDIYGKGIMGFCTYIIPYTLVQYYPLQYLLGKSGNWYYSLYPFGTILFFIVCYVVWKFGMAHYKSCGS